MTLKNMNPPAKMLLVLSFYMLAGPSIFNIGLIDRDSLSGGYSQYYQIAIILTTSFFIYDCIKNNIKIFNFYTYGLIPCFVWVIASVFWSDFAVISARRSFLLIFTTVCLVYSIKTIKIDEILHIIFITSAFIMALNYISVIVGFGIHSYSDVDGALAGNWKGIHPHKNPAGAFCASLLIFSFLGFLWEKKYSFLVLNFATLLFLVKTESKTSLVLGVIFGYLLPIVLFIFKNLNIRYILLSIIIFFSIYIFYEWENFIYYMEDDSFTGRGLIWNTIIPIVEINPWFGYGYGGFWGVGDFGHIHSYATGFVSKLNQGHNAYIDALLTIGIPGLIVSVATFFVVPVFNLKNKSGLIFGFIASVVFFNIFYNFMESSLLAPDFSNWYFLVVVYALSLKSHE